MLGNILSSATNFLSEKLKPVVNNKAVDFVTSAAKQITSSLANPIIKAATTPQVQNVINKYVPDNSTAGIIKNTITGIPKAAVEMGQDIGRQALRVPFSAGEAAGRMITNKPGGQIPGVNVPGFGNIESYQSEVARKVEAGGSKKGAVGSAALDVALNEPFGFALKPIGVAGSLLIKRGGGKVAEKVLSEAEQYVEQQVAKREAARIAEGKPGFASTLYKDIKRKLVDFTAPIEDAFYKAKKASGAEVLPSQDIHSQIDMALRAPTLAGKFVEDNGLKDVIKNVDNLDNLDQYLVAKQAVDVNTRGFETGRDLAKDQMLIKEFAPKYEAAAEKVNQYSRNLLDYSVKTGVVSPELATRLKEIYPNYVPMNRVFNELEQPNNIFGNKGVANLSNQTIVQKLKGSTREVESPFASLLDKTYTAFQQGEKNKAAQILTDFATTPEGASMGIKLKSPGMEKGAGEEVISVFRNGEKVEYIAPKDIADAAKNLNSQQMNILGKIFAFPVRVARLGITGLNIPFIGTNIAKDQIGAFITSNAGARSSLLNPATFMQALTQAIGHGKLYDEFVRAGAGGTSFDIARNATIDSVEKIRAGKDIKSRILYTVKNPSELLKAAENIVGRSEEVTRIAQYVGNKKAALKKGLSEDEAIIEAAKAARENTVNFARRGEWGTVLNSAWLYLNAGIQGSRLLVNSFKNKPVATAAKVATSLFLPLATATAWNISDPKRQEAYRDIQDYEKEGNLIIVPPNPTKDAEGKWNVIKIPLPPGFKSLAQPVRKMVEATHDLSTVGFADMAQALFGALSPIGSTKNEILSTVIPQAIKPTVQATTNTNLFTGLPIVPDSMKNISPELQYKPYTSGTARLVGKAAKWSPIQIEEFVKGTFGGVGSQVINASDRVLAGLDVIPKDQIGGQGIVEGVVGRFAKARGGALDNKTTTQLKEILTKQADDRFILKQSAEVLNDELSTLPKEEANRRVKEIAKANKPLYEALKGVVEASKKGLDYNDRLMLQLGVENGERAKFINETVKSFKTKQEKNAYIADLEKKGIVTKNVRAQLAKMIKEETK